MVPSKTTVSVIIPTWNSWTTLKLCLSSLYRQSLLPVEIIVVDNASADETAKKIKNAFPRVKLICLEKNTGVTGGRNIGIIQAKKDSKYLFFFDHDMIADRNMLKFLVKLSETDKSYGIVTPKIFYWGDKKRVWAAGTNINLWTGQVLFRGGKDKGQFDTVEEVQVAPAALLVKREVIDAVKKFDDRYFATYEDTDFCFRARKYGFKTIYAPSAVAYHKISSKPIDERRRLLDRAYWIGRNRIIFMRKFGRNFYLFLIFSFIYFLYFIKMAIQEKDQRGLINYVKGFVTGLLQSNRL